MNTPAKVLVVLSHPIQYFSPVYKLLSQSPNIDVLVLFGTRVGIDSYFDPGFSQEVRWDIPLTEGFQHKFLSSRRKIGGFQPMLLVEIIRHRPDAVIFHGYSLPTNLVGIFFCKIIGCKVLMRGDTWAQSNRKGGAVHSFKQWLFRRIDRFISIGSLNSMYYRDLGVPEGKIDFAPFCIDNSKFASNDDSPLVKSQFRKKHGIQPESTVILCVAKLIDLKRPIDILHAIKNCGFKDEFAAVFAGSGENGEFLRREAERLGIKAVFLGFVNQTDLPLVYGSADVFVLPSEREPWGLVVNEAMAAGLPVVVSDAVGAHPDLVLPGKTGFVFPVGDTFTLGKIFLKFASDKTLVARMGSNARKHIHAWDVPSCCAGIEKAVHTAIQRQKP